ncbi:hypothetical protein COCNU_06G014960 [Cocos nucifera]|uniref:Uncharacterized protein n=1 Tax=Cocos nucifera TaxID=13894 RepID=A0A8K0ID28_COCNU|nr:hypothetical protein COCNU_06G014960 [Cocos nucifera]
METAGREAESSTAGEPSPFPLKLDQSFRHTEKAERAVNASQSRRAPRPGGAVHRNLNLLLIPRNSSPVHRGRHDHPISSPIITANQIGTAHSKISISISTTFGRRIKSTKLV